MRKKTEIWEWAKALIIAIGIAVFIRSLLFAPYVVEGASMEITIHDRERVIVNKLIYLIGEPERGDIVVVRAMQEQDFIKRVIAVGGDQVEVRDDTLFINGKPIDEPYLAEQKQKAKQNGLSFTEDFGSITIPKGSVFVLGDNRPNSLDSEELGPFEVEKVIGQAEFVFFPFTKMRFLND